jgi:hypothetical protein
MTKTSPSADVGLNTVEQLCSKAADTGHREASHGQVNSPVAARRGLHSNDAKPLAALA